MKMKNNVNINIQNNNLHIHIQPFTKDCIDLESITLGDISKGIDGIKDMLLRFIKYTNGDETKLNYICTDMSRLIFDRLDHDGTWKTDPKGEYIRSIIFPYISKKVHSLYNDYICNNASLGWEQNTEILQNCINISYGDIQLHRNLMHSLKNEIYIPKNEKKIFRRL